MFDTGNKGHLTDQEITDCRTKLRDPKFTDKFLFGLEAKTGHGDTTDQAALRDRVF
jgi:hypothetical protein